MATGLTADETREYPEATLRDFVAPMQDKLLLAGNIQQGEQTARSNSFPPDKVIAAIVNDSVMYAGNRPGLTPGLYAVARIYAPHQAKIGRWMGRQYGIGLAANIETVADDADAEIDTESIDSMNIVPPLTPAAQSWACPQSASVPPQCRRRWPADDIGGAGAGGSVLLGIAPPDGLY